MTDKAFADQLQKKINESLYGFGSKDTPVQNLSFPDSGQNSEVEPIESQTNVTQGETRPLGEPRDDMTAEKQGGPLDTEVANEISSLLVSIGYILSKESIVPDKFDTAAVLTVLNTHFKQVPVTEQPPCETPVNTDSPVVAIGGPEIPKLEFSNPAVNTYMESRKLLESKHA